MARLLRPRSVAIVGVSPEPSSFGGAVLANLERFGFRGAIHLVSRTHGEIGGRRCVASIDELPRDVDVAVLTVPRAAVIEAVTACARRGFGAAIVYAAGFAEVDEAGVRDQATLAQIAGDAGMAINGPNCIGFANYVDGVALSFERIEPQDLRNRPALGIVAQSGATVTSLRSATLAKGTAVSYAISTGNEASLGIEEFLAYLIVDAATRVVAIFAEQIRRPALFLALAAAARRNGKALVMMHPGRSARARESARSHTGALAGNYAVMRTLVRHAAVVLVETIEELIDTATLLVSCPTPPTAGAAIITNSGAFKGFALDFCETIGLDLPLLAPATVEALARVLPSYAALDNPLDVTAQGIREPQIFGRSAEALLADPGIGSLIVSIVPGGPAQAMDKARSLLPALAAAAKPKAVAILGDEMPLAQEFVAGFRDAGLPFFRSPERALRAMAHATAYGKMLATARTPPPSLALDLPLLPSAGVIPEHEAKPFLAALGIPVPPGALVRDVAAARRAASEIGYPVALKAQIAGLAHKSDVGGVILGIGDEAALDRGWEALAVNIADARPDLALDRVLVEAMARPGLEMVVGGRRDPEWGPVLMAGLGGVWIEALEDVRLMPATLDRDAILEELLQLKGARLLRGFRGGPAADLAALVDAIFRLGALMQARPELAEIDINPLVVYPAGEGVLALDALIVAN